MTTLTIGFDRQDLMDIDPVLAEAIGTPGQVDAPDAQGLVGYQLARLPQ